MTNADHLEARRVRQEIAKLRRVARREHNRSQSAEPQALATRRVLAVPRQTADASFSVCWARQSG